MTCKTPGCSKPARRDATRCAKHQRAYLTRIGAQVTLATRFRALPAPPLAPPVQGVESAHVFADRLARSLCAGDPLSSFVVEILQAVRKRDAAIVKAKDDEAYAVSVAAAARSR